MAITGGCMCGKVRYRIEAEPATSRVCWCRDCQFVGAGSGTVNVTFPADAVTIEGTLADYPSTADSGNLMHRGFCPSCGTPVTTQSEARPHFLAVRAGTLDDPEIGKPVVTIWTSSAPSWACFDEDLPQERKQLAPPAAKR
ncbi:MAG: GFA family protein [Methyloceanibacter sp.]